MMMMMFVIGCVEIGFFLTDARHGPSMVIAMAVKVAIAVEVEDAVVYFFIFPIPPIVVFVALTHSLFLWDFKFYGMLLREKINCACQCTACPSKSIPILIFPKDKTTA